MDLEASIVERLDKLRQWQIEQQARLLKQQQIQREILTQKQDCMYKAFEISIQGLDLNDSVTCTNEPVENNENVQTDLENSAVMSDTLYKDDNCMEVSKSLVHKQQSVIQNRIDEQSIDNSICIMNESTDLACTPQKMDKHMAELSIDGVSPLVFEKAPVNRISIDDVPIPSPRKDFQTLLEERLKDCQTMPNEDLKTNSSVKAKKPFLKKGHGLSRFRLNRASSSAKKVRPRSVSVSASTHPSTYNKNNVTKHRDVPQPLRNSQLKKNTGSTNLLPRQLCLKNVPPPQKKVRSKSESASSNTQSMNHTNQSMNILELNTSDYRSKTQKEMEEVRIFELLEEKAENSSFCSTSSAVLAILQQSTPFKLKKKIPSTEAGIIDLKQKRSPNVKNTQAQPLVTRISQYGVSNKVGHQSNQTRTHTSYSQSHNSHWESTNPTLSLPTAESGNRIVHDAHTNVQSFQRSSENDKINPSVQSHSLLRKQIQNLHDQKNSYNLRNTTDTDEVDVSLHVRFSEYNEYKTIGLTDTSTISNESLAIKNFCDEKAWSDSLTPDTSDTEISSVKHETEIGVQESKSVQCNTLREFNRGSINFGNKRENNRFAYNNDIRPDISANIEESSFSIVTDPSSRNGQSNLGQYDEKNLSFEIDENCDKIDNISESVEADNIKKNNKYSDMYNGTIHDQDQEKVQDLQDQDGPIFKSDLLKDRLLELEQEIDIFRKENASLAKQRQKLQDDHNKLRREYTEKEKNMEETIRQAENRLQEERKKLAREKAALESRLRDSQEKAQQSKLDRQEMQNLRLELEDLKDEINTKESRWSAMQSRQKCQMRILKMENTKLKQEIERLQNSKKAITKSKQKSGIFSNARAIHQINKQLNMQIKEPCKVPDDSLSNSETKLVGPMMEAIGVTCNSKNMEEETSSNVETSDDGRSMNCNVYEKLQKPQQSMKDIVKKRMLYENLIKEATGFAMSTQDKSEDIETIKISQSKIEDHANKTDVKMNGMKDHFKESEINRNSVPFHYTGAKDANHLEVQDNDYIPLTSLSEASQDIQDLQLTAKSPKETVPIISTKNIPLPFQNDSKMDKQDTREIHHADGRTEYWYSNGNVKKVFPDQGLTKMIYYNGDVRETDSSGKVRYFYASTRTWHTTTPDGLEILEFPDGQVERRSSSGTVEVSFPDGSVRILQTDGSEKWALTDGTIVETFTNGEKILTLPNGQREVHTKAHKRREYPDGTIKLVYPDGSQETRYSNGRTRLKDKDGHLLMDSYQ